MNDVSKSNWKISFSDYSAFNHWNGQTLKPKLLAVFVHNKAKEIMTSKVEDLFNSLYAVTTKKKVLCQN